MTIMLLGLFQVGIDHEGSFLFHYLTVGLNMSPFLPQEHVVAAGFLFPCYSVGAQGPSAIQSIPTPLPQKEILVTQFLLPKARQNFILKQIHSKLLIKK